MNGKKKQRTEVKLTSPDDVKYKIFHQEAYQPKRKRKSGGMTAVSLAAVERPEGIRFYHGKADVDEPGKEESINKGFAISEHVALEKSVSSPSDSVTTKKVLGIIKPKNTKDVLNALKKNPDFYTRIKSKS